jgi:GntR family transcriptional regulator/MocR family aminotransferase
VAERALEPVARDGLVLGFSGFTPAQILAGVLGLRQAIGDLAVR